MLGLSLIDLLSKDEYPLSASTLVYNKLAPALFNVRHTQSISFYRFCPIVGPKSLLIFPNHFLSSFDFSFYEISNSNLVKLYVT